MGYDIRTDKDIEKLLSKHSKLIVKKIKAITTKVEPKPGREFEIYLIDLHYHKILKVLCRD